MTRQLTEPYRLLQNRFNLKAAEPMSRHTSFRVGGPADLFAMPATEQELLALLTAANALSIPVTIIGGGTNLLVRDKGIRGLVICLSGLAGDIRPALSNHETVELTIQAGTRLSKVCHYAIEHALTGLEFAAGIPGTLGGAVKMNAGTPAGDLSFVVTAIKIIDKTTAKILTITRDDLIFNYRRLDLKEKDINAHIILEIVMRLKKGEPGTIKSAYDHHLEKRNLTQPVSLASAGCFFKNPDQGKPAGEMIDLCGLKGKRIGQAMVSEKHANYIVNTGHATCEDILQLARKVRQAVFETFNITLNTEVIIEGE